MGARAAKPGATAFILSMTTTPTRLNDALARRVLALLHALPASYTLDLNVPWVLRRTGAAYGDIPPSLAAHPRVTVRRTPDVGPITKLLPTLQARQSQRAVVVVIDDDIVYAPAYIRKLTHGMTADTTWMRGQTSGGAYSAGDFIEGFRGYAVPLPLITPAILQELRVHGTRAGTPCFSSDDYVVGRVLRAHGVHTAHFDATGVPAVDTRQSVADTDALWRHAAAIVPSHARYDACAAQMDRQIYNLA